VYKVFRVPPELTGLGHATEGFCRKCYYMRANSNSDNMSSLWFVMSCLCLINKKIKLGILTFGITASGNYFTNLGMTIACDVPHFFSFLEDVNVGARDIHRV
jgi:hypothetical protein